MRPLDGTCAPRDLSPLLPSPRAAEPAGASLAMPDDEADLSRSWADEPRSRASAPAAVPSPPADPGRTRRRTWVDHVLSVGAVLGVLVAGATVAATVTGLRPLVVRSGSMEPTIATGGMVLTREIAAPRIRVGDVLAVERPDHTRVTHRVTQVLHRDGTAELTLKGDANEDVDPVPVTVTSAGEVVYSAPWLGFASAFLASAKGGFLLGCLVGAVVVATLRRRPAR